MFKIDFVDKIILFSNISERLLFTRKLCKNFTKTNFDYDSDPSTKN